MTTFRVKRSTKDQKQFAVTTAGATNAATMAAKANNPLLTTGQKLKLGGLAVAGTAGVLATKSAMDAKDIIEGNMDKVQ